MQEKLKEDIERDLDHVRETFRAAANTVTAQIGAAHERAFKVVTNLTILFLGAWIGFLSGNKLSTPDWWPCSLAVYVAVPCILHLSCLLGVAYFEWSLLTYYEGLTKFLQKAFIDQNAFLVSYRTALSGVIAETGMQSLLAGMQKDGLALKDSLDKDPARVKAEKERVSVWRLGAGILVAWLLTVIVSVVFLANAIST